MIVVIVVAVPHLQALLFLKEVKDKERKYHYLLRKKNLPDQDLLLNNINANVQEQTIIQREEETDINIH